jgi:hypothetical protein
VNFNKGDYMKNLKHQTKDASMILFGISLICIIVSLLSSCGKQTGPQGSNGSTGSQGNTGATGAKGSQGLGAGLQVTQLQVGNANCSNGGVQLINFQDLTNSGIYNSNDPILGLTYVCNGINGSNGSNGTNGTNGTDGTNTTFNIVPDNGTNCTNGGFDLTLTDSTQSQTTYICNGVNGSNGVAGLDGTNGSNGGTVTLNLVQVIEPCGAASSPWKEVLLGLQGGQILSDFSETTGGQDTRLSFIPNGSYQDTDESGCTFTVTGDGLTNSQISWSAGSNQYSTWSAGGFDWTANTGWVAQ